MTAELRTFVDIDASPERVWQVLTDLPAYPLWNPFVTSAVGAFAVGGRLSFSVPPSNLLLRVSLRAKVLEVTPYRRLRFTLRFARFGVPGLFDSDHTLTITEEDGGVRLWEEAQFRGLLVPPMMRSLNRDRSPAFAAMNTALKVRAEGVQPSR